MLLSLLPGKIMASVLTVHAFECVVLLFILICGRGSIQNLQRNTYMCRFGHEWQAAAMLGLCVQACAFSVSFFSHLPHEHLFKHIHYCDNRLNLQFTICLNNINLHATFYYYCLAFSEIQNPPK